MDDHAEAASFIPRRKAPIAAVDVYVRGRGWKVAEAALLATGPKTNGKVERFHQTISCEWGYGMAYRTDRHSALDGRSPINRVRNLPGHGT